MRPIALVVPPSENHTFLSGPAANSAGSLPLFRPLENSVICPLGVTRPTAVKSANHRLPSGRFVVVATAAPRTACSTYQPTRPEVKRISGG